MYGSIHLNVVYIMYNTIEQKNFTISILFTEKFPILPLLRRSKPARKRQLMSIGHLSPQF